MTDAMVRHPAKTRGATRRFKGSAPRFVEQPRPLSHPAHGITPSAPNDAMTAIGLAMGPPAADISVQMPSIEEVGGASTLFARQYEGLHRDVCAPAKRISREGVLSDVNIVTPRSTHSSMKSLGLGDPNGFK